MIAGSQYAVGCFNYGHLCAGQAKAHHGATHYQSAAALFIELAVLKHMTDCCADKSFIVAVNATGITCHGGDSRDQGLAINNSPLNSIGGTYIDAHHTYIGGQPATGYLLAGEYIN